MPAAPGDGEAAIRRAGLHLAGLFVNQSWGYWHRDFGSVATGAARAQLGLDAVRALGLDVTTPALAAITAENLVLLDRLEEAAATVDVPLGPCEGTFMEPFVRSARGLVRARLRRLDEAEVDFRATFAAGDARGWTSPFATRGRLRLAELLAGRGDREEFSPPQRNDHPPNVEETAPMKEMSISSLSSISAVP